MLTLRPRTDVQAEYERAVAKLNAGPSSALNPRLQRHEIMVLTACRDSLAWVAGHTRQAPWSGRHLPNPTEHDLFSEWSQAETVDHNTALMRDDESRFWYGSAVAHALAWARGADTNEPAGPHY